VADSPALKAGVQAEAAAKVVVAEVLARGRGSVSPTMAKMTKVTTSRLVAPPSTS
jgi:hypothetical protein